MTESTTKRCAICGCKAALKDVNERLRAALSEILDLLDDLPGGIDLEADESNQSPADLVAHIGGLIYRVADDALLNDTQEKRT